MMRKNQQENNEVIDLLSSGDEGPFNVDSILK